MNLNNELDILQVPKRNFMNPTVGGVIAGCQSIIYTTESNDLALHSKNILTGSIQHFTVNTCLSLTSHFTGYRCSKVLSNQ